jgi:hypothetical protein
MKFLNALEQARWHIRTLMVSYYRDRCDQCTDYFGLDIVAIKN